MNQKKCPSAKAILILVNEHKEFIIKSKEDRIIAGAIVLWKFHTEINIHLNIASLSHLSKILQEIQAYYHVETRSPAAFIIGTICIIISVILLEKNNVNNIPGSLFGIVGGFSAFFEFLYWRGILK